MVGGFSLPVWGAGKSPSSGREAPFAALLLGSRRWAEAQLVGRCRRRRRSRLSAGGRRRPSVCLCCCCLFGVSACLCQRLVQHLVSLPEGITYRGFTNPSTQLGNNRFSCSAAGQEVTCTRSNGVNVTSLTSPALGFAVQVDVAAPTSPTVTATAALTNSNDVNPGRPDKSPPPRPGSPPPVRPPSTSLSNERSRRPRRCSRVVTRSIPRRAAGSTESAAVAPR